jgi:sister-chromatid-cohesion protein PDS5
MLSWFEGLTCHVIFTCTQVDSGLMLNEQTLARLLHLLSNHPDFIIKVPEDDDVFGGAQLTHSVQDLNLAAK